MADAATEPSPAALLASLTLTPLSNASANRAMHRRTYVFTSISAARRAASGNPIPVWRAIWPVFGATNQLLGALALLTVSVWLKRTGRRNFFMVIPMNFMLAVTLLALSQLALKEGPGIIGAIAALLLVLAVVLIVEAIRAYGGEVVPDTPAGKDTIKFEGGKAC